MKNVTALKKLPSLKKMPSYALDNITSRNNYSLSLQAGALSSRWKPAYSDKKDDDFGLSVRLVDYHAASLESYQFEGKLRFMGLPFLKYHYEAPWVGTPQQREMVEVERRSTAGLEKFIGGVKLDPLAKAIGLEEYRLARFALSVQFVYTKEHFFGTARARRDFSYFPSSASLDENFVPSEIIPVRTGDELQFKTTFSDREYSIDVLPLINGLELFGRNDYELRIGWFDTTWRRPSDTNTNFTYLDGSIWYVPLFNDRSTAGSRLLLDTEFKSTGFSLVFGTVDASAPGLQGNVFVRSGTDNRIVNNLEDAPSTTYTQLYSSDIYYSDIGANLQYNKYFQGKTFCLSGGAGVLKREMAVPYLDSDLARTSDTELLWKLFLTATLRLNAGTVLE